MRKHLERFPRRIHSVDDLPPATAEAVRSWMPVEAVRQIIIIPPGEYPIRRTMLGMELSFGWRRTPERTLLFGDEALRVIETEQGVVTPVAAIPYAALVDLHLYHVLLYAWVALAWKTRRGIETFKAEYNAVGSAMIWQALAPFRTAFAACRVPDPGGALSRELPGVPLKFRNYLRSGLMGDETLIAAVYQPAIQPQPGRWAPFISPNRLFSVTDHAIIVLEDHRDRFRSASKALADYTISQHFFPLAHLDAADLTAGLQADRLALRLSLDGVPYEAAFPMNVPEARPLCDLLRACRAPEPARA